MVKQLSLSFWSYLVYHLVDTEVSIIISNFDKVVVLEPMFCKLFNPLPKGPTSPNLCVHPEIQAYRWLDSYVLSSIVSPRIYVTQ